MTDSDRVVLVTGGGHGIGRAVATIFARDGANVAIADRSEDAAWEAASAITAETGATVLPLMVDVRDASAVNDAVRPRSGCRPFWRMSTTSTAMQPASAIASASTGDGPALPSLSSTNSEAPLRAPNRRSCCHSRVAFVAIGITPCGKLDARRPGWSVRATPGRQSASTDGRGRSRRAGAC